MSAVASCVATDIEQAVRRGSPERCERMLQKVINLFLSTAYRLSEPQMKVFDDVIVLLMQRIEAKTLIQISRHLSDSDYALRGTVRYLAFHEKGSVASPVLRRSGWLLDEDLIEIAGTRSERHLLAISDRETLHQDVTDALLKRGGTAVSYALATNAGARFSDFGYQSMVESAAGDAGLAAKLGARSDIPPKVRSQLLSNGTRAVQNWLFQTAPSGPPETIRAADLARTISARATAAQTSPPDAYAEAEASVRALSRAARLNDSTLCRFALRGEYAHIVSALSLLSVAPREVIEPLLTGAPQGLMVACRAARLDWSTVMTIICSRRDCPAVSAQELDEGKKMFHALSLSAAQQAVQSWSLHGAVRRAEAAARH